MGLLQAVNSAAGASKSVVAAGALSVALWVGTIVNIAGDYANGQKTGNLLDAAVGVVDVSQEDYYEDGGTESGTLAGALGGVAGSVGTTAVTYGMHKNPILRKFAPLLFAWKGAQFASEALWSDGDGLKDTLDMADDVAGMFILAKTTGIGTAAKQAIQLISKKASLDKVLSKVPADRLTYLKNIYPQTQNMNVRSIVEKANELDSVNKELVEVLGPSLGLVKSTTDTVRRAWAG